MPARRSPHLHRRDDPADARLQERVQRQQAVPDRATADPCGLRLREVVRDLLLMDQAEVSRGWACPDTLEVHLCSPELWAEDYFSTLGEEPLLCGARTALSPLSGGTRLRTPHKHRQTSLSLSVDEFPQTLNYVPIMPLCATPSQLTDFTESAI